MGRRVVSRGRPDVDFAARAQRPEQTGVTFDISFNAARSLRLIESWLYLDTVASVKLPQRALARSIGIGLIIIVPQGYCLTRQKAAL